MTRLPLLLVPVLLLAACNGEAPQDAEGPAPAHSLSPAPRGVSGIVTDREGSPIGGVEVRVKLSFGAGHRGWKEGTAAETGEDGKFLLDIDRELGLVTETTAFVFTKKAGFLPTVLQIEHFRPGDRRRLRIPLTQGGTITGTVLDESGEPIADALVYGIHPKVPGAEREDILPTTLTGEDGSYVLADVPPGPFCAAARAEGYVPAVGNPVTVTAAAEVVAPDLRLSRGGSVSGIVRTSAGAPVFRATVRAWRARELRPLRLYGLATMEFAGGCAVTGPDGSFTITGLADAEYFLDAEAMGHKPREDEPGKVRPGDDPVELVLAPGVLVKLVALNSRTLQAVPEYVVAVTPLTGGDLRTVVEEIESAEGPYEFRVLPGLRHQIEVSASGFEVHVREAVFAADTTPVLKIPLLPR